jgi:transcriptional regulator EpsA
LCQGDFHVSEFLFLALLVMSIPQSTHIDPRMMALIMECGTVQTAEEFSQLCAGILCEVLPHEILVCGIHVLTEDGNKIHKMVSRNYPRAYFDEIPTKMGMVDTPLMKKWRAARAPTAFQSGRDDHEFPEEWVRLFCKYDLYNAIGHGVTDIAGNLGSFFLFYRLPGELTQQHASILEIAIPHLHVALLRVASTIDDSQANVGATSKSLNTLQRQILYWLHEGKTNWEIAAILSISERNVKHHIKQIFLNLEVHTRAHAVAKANNLGLLLETRP